MNKHLSRSAAILSALSLASCAASTPAPTKQIEPATTSASSAADAPIGRPTSADPAQHPSATATISAPPVGTTQDWKAAAKKYVPQGAADRAVYTNNVDGAVVALEDVMKLLFWEFSEFYDGGTHDAASPEDEYETVTRMFFRTMSGAGNIFSSKFEMWFPPSGNHEEGNLDSLFYSPSQELLESSPWAGLNTGRWRREADLKVYDAVASSSRSTYRSKYPPSAFLGDPGRGSSIALNKFVKSGGKTQWPRYFGNTAGLTDVATPRRTASFMLPKEESKLDYEQDSAIARGRQLGREDSTVRTRGCSGAGIW